MIEPHVIRPALLDVLRASARPKGRGDRKRLHARMASAIRNAVSSAGGGIAPLAIDDLRTLSRVGCAKASADEFAGWRDKVLSATRQAISEVDAMLSIQDEEEATMLLLQ